MASVTDQACRARFEQRPISLSVLVDHGWTTDRIEENL
jgi:hypothetical protein